MFKSEMVINVQNRFYSANDYYRRKFNDKIIKISIDAGFTCPNRDGRIGTGGCIFCSERGSGDFAPSSKKSVSEQFEEMKIKMSNKWKSGKYLIYFQAFTNTYADADILEELYNEAISLENVVGISIATRPDSISDDAYALLERLSKKAYVSVELGLQTANETTAVFINRCFENHVFKNAVRRLQSKNIDVTAHVILGLPYETKEDMLYTARYCSELCVSGIKLQLLNVLKNTQLEIIYNHREFDTLTLEEYVDIVASCIGIIAPDIVIHRLTGDGPKELLVAPRFLLDKRRVLNAINNELIKRDIWQGKYYNVSTGEI